MGNQREIRQVEPRSSLGVVLKILPDKADAVRDLLGQFAKGHFYTLLIPAGESVAFPNLDGPNVDLGLLPGEHLAIQSGGKMWCGYEDFVDHVRQLAPFVEEGLFFVGDEEDYIDEFRIRSGKLNYSRVHSGSWWPVDDFLRTRGIVG